MRKKSIGTFLLLAALTFSACTNVEDSQEQEAIITTTNQPNPMDTHAQIIRVYTNLLEELGWWVVPKNVSTMTIYVDSNNVETVLFWFVPGGTETWSERTLLGYDKDGSDGWSLKWEFGNRTFHDYIYVQALGNDGSTQAIQTINITTQD